jgi:hypothetical protein
VPAANIRRRPDFRAAAPQCNHRQNCDARISLIFKAMPVDGMLRRIQGTPEHLPQCNAGNGK